MLKLYKGKDETAIILGLNICYTQSMFWEFRSGLGPKSNGEGLLEVEKKGQDY